MSKAYDPAARNNAMVVKYMVKTSGDRWFIPYNTPGSGCSDTSKAAQVTQCSLVVNDTADGTVAGAQSVGSYTATVTPKTAPLM
tara:strand:- start:251 stop:502 length:252 start_codon:yes stop_codon:yes gene_type:complete